MPKHICPRCQGPKPGELTYCVPCRQALNKEAGVKRQANRVGDRARLQALEAELAVIQATHQAELARVRATHQAELEACNLALVQLQLKHIELLEKHVELLSRER